MKEPILLAAGLLSAALGFAGCGHKPEHPAAESLPAAVVRVQTVESKRQLATEEVVGTMRAKLHAAIEAKVSGRIERMLVVPGQTVKAGDLLAQLDARKIQTRLDQAMPLREQSSRDTER